MPVRTTSSQRAHRRFRRHARRAVRCPLCAHVGLDGSRRRTLLRDFPTAQRELIAGAIAGQLHLNPGRAFCRPCLVRVERRILARQIVRDGGTTFFVDRRLAPYPIMPAPMRLDAIDEVTGRGITICFVDSGFVPHPDFVDGDSRIDAIYDAARGRRLSTITSRGEPPIAAWHGTMTSASAVGNGSLSAGLYRGIARDARVVMAATMTPHGGIHTPQVVRALRWILRSRALHDIRIVSMSVGVDEVTESLDHPVVALIEELVASGVVVIAAAGNGANEPLVPPAWAPSAITVGGYDDRNSTDPRRWSLWYGSSGTTLGGAHKPELLAPSVWLAAPILLDTAVKREAEALFELAGADDLELMKLIPTRARFTPVGPMLRRATEPRLARSIVHRRILDEKLITDAYKHVDGTSFAAPLVASVVAQLLEVRPGLTPADVREILLASALRLHDVPEERQGAGVVRARAAVALARNR